MKFHRVFLLTTFTLLFSVTLIWDVWLYTLPSHITLWNYFYNIIYGSIFFVGGLASIISAFQFSLKSNLGKMILFLGMGLLSYWLGNTIWAYYTLVLNVEIPYPSLADAAYMIMYPLMVIGVFYLMKLYRTQITVSLIRDSFVIIIISFAIIFGFFARPDLSVDLPILQRFANIYYPFADVVILSMALIVLRIGGWKTHPSLYIFTFGMLMMTMGDILFTYRNAVGTYWNGDVSDLFYTFAGYFLSIGLFEIIYSVYTATVTQTISEPEINAPAS